MKNYENGEETKKTILEACRKLFFEKGYKNTTFDLIASEANVYRTSIAYHFKSKAAIHEIIFFESYEKNITEALKYTNCAKYSVILGSIIFWYKFLISEAYRNFYLSNLHDSSFRKEDTQFYYQFLVDCFGNRFCCYDDFMKIHQFDIAIAMNVDSFLMKYVSDNPLKFDCFMITNYQFQLTAKLFNISENEFKVIWATVMDNASLIPFEEIVAIF